MVSKEKNNLKANSSAINIFSFFQPPYYSTPRLLEILE